ncbi:MAG TPA: hypothetical protein VG387_16500 [Rhizomicrobium sp.]|nr:hypothetical protein [Rhizomicrobium sp.]
MTRMAGLVAAMALAVMWVAPAQAQATRTWISGVGDDVNPCSRTAPCKTFAGAISKTAAGGEIDTLDPGGFGAVTVTKAMTLADEGAGEAGILVAGTNGITVNCVSDPNCVVVIRGLILDGGPVGSNSLNGVRFIAGRSLVIQNCMIRNFTGGSPNGYGVAWNGTPNSAVPEHLIISDTSITTNGAGSGTTSTGGGVSIAPTAGTGSLSVVLDRVVIGTNTNGVNFNTTAMTTGTVQATITNSDIEGGQTGITTSGTPITNIQINDTRIVGNAGYGIITAGAGTTLKIGSSVISGNGTSVLQALGSLTSYGNNQIDMNGTNTLPSTTGTALH